MLSPKDISSKNYTYNLPLDKIAKYPVSQRDQSKLLVYENGSIAEKKFTEISTHIPEGATLVFNNTKVVQARIVFEKESGGKIEVFCLQPAHKKTWETALNETDKVEMECLIGGIGKWKNGPLEKKIYHNNKIVHLQAYYKEDATDGKLVLLSWDNSTIPFYTILELAGETPLPPYLQRKAEKEDTVNYQTHYALHKGSVAAPTAGLHFTEGVFDSLQKKGIHKTFITLHVGAGTFKPIKSETLDKHDMHREWICITKKQLHDLINAKQIVAVGTTSLRHLESMYWLGVLMSNSGTELRALELKQWQPYELKSSLTKNEAFKLLLDKMETEGLEEFFTTTQLLIVPGYRFRVADALITNFHQPGSTLLLLVAAAVGDDWKTIYDYAIQNDFRFLSYGDSSLLWIKKSI